MTPPAHAGRLALAGALVLLLAACGSSANKTTPTSTIAVGSEPSTTASPATTAATTTPATSATAPTTTSAATAATTPAAAKYPVGCVTVATPTPRPQPHLKAPKQTLVKGKTYVATLQTNCGTIKIKLANAQAPKTANSFAYLVRTGFYNGLTFHRIVPGFVIQGGDPLGTGEGGPGYTIVEAPPASLKYTDGVVAMAKTSAQPSGASGSQFFIVVGSGASSLPAQYALVGHVTGSMAAANAIAKVPANAETGQPSAPVVIKKATISGG